MTHFDHERIPERIVHARGSAAHGTFTPYKAPRSTRARRFSRTRAVETPVFVRFSTVAGGAGSVDLPRDVRGFATKFYTSEGNFDLVGNNIPVFFIQDAMKFPDFVHSVKMEPDRGFPQNASAHDTFWDFVSLDARDDAHADVGDVGSRDPALVPDDGGIRRPHVQARRREGRRARSSSGTGGRSSARSRWRGTRRARSTAPIRTSIAAICSPRSRPARSPSTSSSIQPFAEEDADDLDFDILDATKLIPEEVSPARADRQDGARSLAR